MKNVPEEIWLTTTDDEWPDDFNAAYRNGDVEWCEDPKSKGSIRYLHADTVMADMRMAYIAMLSAQVTLALMASADTLLDAAIEIVGSKYQEVKGE